MSLRLSINNEYAIEYGDARLGGVMDRHAFGSLAPGQLTKTRFRWHYRPLMTYDEEKSKLDLL